VDLLFIMPGVERFAYFRLGDRIARGQASPQELLATQDRFDNHFLKSEIWDAHRHAEGSTRETPHPRGDGPDRLLARHAGVGSRPQGAGARAQSPEA
jgi:hypothetical protein